jgi:hypothetical protein
VRGALVKSPELQCGCQNVNVQQRNSAVGCVHTQIYRKTKFMSISFRNDFGPDARVVNGTHPDARPDARTGAGLAVPSPGPSAIVAMQTDPRFTDNRTPELRTPELRTPELRTPELRSIDARLTEIKTGATPRDLSDVKMDQIRELLFGEVQRSSEHRITTLEAKVHDLETALHHRLDAMQARIEALAAETRGDRQSTLDELARGIADLGDRVKRIPRD